MNLLYIGDYSDSRIIGYILSNPEEYLPQGRLLSRIISTEITLTFESHAGRAIMLAEEIRPLLIILDMDIPDMDGFEALEQLRKQCPYANIIAFCKNGNRKVLFDVLNSGASDLITRPLDIEIFLARLGIILTMSEIALAVVPEKTKITCKTPTLILDSQEISLTPMEGMLIGNLIKNHGKIVPHPQLKKILWGKILGNQDIYVYVKEINNKTRRRFDGKKVIFNKRGEGYYVIDVNLILIYK